MPEDDHRLGLVMIVWLAESAGMRELQADHQAIVRSHPLAMSGDQRFAQVGDLAEIRFVDQQLIWIGSAVG